MSSYRYRITVETLSSAAETDETQSSFTFETSMHDNLFRIVDAVQRKGLVEAEAATGLAVGLKLFAEVVIHHRKDPNFAPFEAPLRRFIGSLKHAAS